VGVHGDDLRRKVVARDNVSARRGARCRGRARTRYGWVKRSSPRAYQAGRSRRHLDDKLDKVLTHKLWGNAGVPGDHVRRVPVDLYWAKPLMEAVDSVALGVEVVESEWIGPLRALLVDGVLKGVGGVLVFLRKF